MIKIEFLYQKWCSYEFKLGNYTFKIKLSKYYSYLNDKGSVRKKDQNFREKHTSVYTGMPV